MKQFFLVVCVLLTATACKQHKSALSLDERPIYNVHKATAKIKVDGVLDKEWEKAEVRTFDYYYLTEKEEEKQATYFRMLWDDENLYLFYDVKDEFINANEIKRDGAVYLDDCVEAFFIPVPSAENIHYCFEMNPNKAVNDIVFVNDFYNGANTSVKAFNPNYNIAVKLKGTLNNNSDVDKGWTLEIAIPKETFNITVNQYPIEKGSRWAFLALKQMRDSGEIGRRMMSSMFPIENVEEKDVHQPSMFGLLEFVD
ncbi:carbohydrate-binding family 9-like protein [Wenyingzhuangia sp. IMCC45574]